MARIPRAPAALSSSTLTASPKRAGALAPWTRGSGREREEGGNGAAPRKTGCWKARGAVVEAAPTSEGTGAGGSSSTRPEGRRLLSRAPLRRALPGLRLPLRLPLAAASTRSTGSGPRRARRRSRRASSAATTTEPTTTFSPAPLPSARWAACTRSAPFPRARARAPLPRRPPPSPPPHGLSSSPPRRPRPRDGRGGVARVTGRAAEEGEAEALESATTAPTSPAGASVALVGRRRAATRRGRRHWKQRKPPRSERRRAVHPRGSRRGRRLEAAGRPPPRETAGFRCSGRSIPTGMAGGSGRCCLPPLRHRQVLLRRRLLRARPTSAAGGANKRSPTATKTWTISHRCPRHCRCGRPGRNRRGGRREALRRAGRPVAAAAAAATMPVTTTVRRWRRWRRPGGGGASFGAGLKGRRLTGNRRCPRPRRRRRHRHRRRRR